MSTAFESVGVVTHSEHIFVAISTNHQGTRSSFPGVAEHSREMSNLQQDDGLACRRAGDFRVATDDSEFCRSKSLELARSAMRDRYP